jgi:epoxyqueuosine reductase
MRGAFLMLRSFFAEENIEYFGLLPFSVCRLRRPDIIERRGVPAEAIRSAIMLLIPYYVHDGEGNISLYARSGDYHHYSDALFERLAPKLEAAFGGRFLGFADKSPIEENVAASMAGLGVLGDNYMLINEKYGSFVFLAEILSTVEPEALGYGGETAEPSYCMHCGACKKACPMAIDGMDCLSAVTQKKGTLSDEEAAYLQKYGSAWGCDLCQLSCPLNKKVLASGVETPIDFFRKDRISTLTAERLMAMSDEEFKSRSFSWRGKAPLLRNLEILSR